MLESIRLHFLPYKSQSRPHSSETMERKNILLLILTVFTLPSTSDNTLQFASHFQDYSLGHVPGADTSVMIHTFIFSSQLFLLPRTYYASQVTPLLADAHYGPNAQEMLPKGLTAPNNITCFLLYPHKQALLYLFWTSNDFKKYYIDEIFSLDCLTWSYFSEYCSKYRLYDPIWEKYIFIQVFSVAQFSLLFC